MADGMLIKVADVCRMLGLDCGHGSAIEHRLPWETLVIGRIGYVWRDQVAAWMVEAGGVKTLDEAHGRLRGAMIKGKPRKRKQVALAG